MVVWDIQDMQLPTLDSAHFNGFGGDSYAIDAKGETVVIAVFNDWADSFILKSTDNGSNWIRTTFIDFPVDKYTVDSGLDLDNNGVTDTIFSTDNYGAILIDNNDKVHIFTGNMGYLDRNLTDNSFSWLTMSDGLLYWNEDMGEDNTTSLPQSNDLWYSENIKLITNSIDFDGNNKIKGIDSTASPAIYYSSLTSMPSAGIDTNGVIYLTYSAYTENIDNGLQSFWTYT